MATPTPVDVTLDAGWAIGSMFGGALARTLAGVARAAVTDGGGRVPVSTSVVFLRPAAPGPARVLATVVREGRRYSTVSCSLETEGGVAATALITLAPSGSLATLGAAEPAQLPPAAGRARGTSSVADRVDWRCAQPWRTGERSEIVRSWVRVHEDEPLDPARYLVASDLAGPAIAAAGVPLPFRIATVALTVEALALSASPWLEQRMRAEVDGELAIVRLDLHDPAGVLVATATQRAVVLPATSEELPWSVTAFGWGN